MAGKKANKPYTGPVRLIIFRDGDTIHTMLCKDNNGKLIEQKKFSDNEQYKKYRKAQKGKYDEFETLRIKNPWAKPWNLRYDLTEWKDDAFQVPNTASLLDCFTALCDENQHCPKAQAPLLLLGTFLSGYTSEVFSDIEEQSNGSSRVRAVVLNSPWTEGITDFLRNLTEAFSLNLFQCLKTDCHLHFTPNKKFSATNETKQIKPVANPYWTRTLRQLPFNGKTTKETIIGKVQIPVPYRNTSVLIEQWTGLQSRSVEDFLRQNPFCAAVVVRKPQAHIAVEGQLSLNGNELIWADDAFHSWDDLQNLMCAFVSAVLNDPNDLMWAIIDDVWCDSEHLIARYQAQKGVAHLTVTQRRIWRLLVASLLAFLEFLRSSAKRITSEEYSLLREEWLWRLLPGCIAGSSTDRPPLKQRPVIVEQDYLEIFHALVEHIQKADGGSHILHVARDERLFELQDPENPDIEVFGYYADVYLRSAGQSFYCLVLRKQTLLNLMRTFMPEVVSVSVDAGRVLRYALKTDWAKQSVLMQADGYFKMHMPVDLTDKRTTYAVAIKMNPAKRNEVKDIVKILDITANPDGSKTTKVIHQPV